MAILLTPVSAVRREERTDEAIISIPYGKTPVVRVLRVTRDTLADGSIIEASRRWVERDIVELLADTDAAPLVALLPAIFDRWSTEDITP